MSNARPPFDPELGTVAAAIADSVPATLTADMIPEFRRIETPGASRSAVEDMGLVARDVAATGHDGTEIVLSVIHRPERTGIGPGIYYVHGGGMVMGDRWNGVLGLAEWAQRLNAVIVTVEYRLAPEHPDPTPVEDCYTGLVWTAAHSKELGIDPKRLMVAGVSAGGGLAAGTALLARDRQGPVLCAQLLMCPMLDDRDSTVSTGQFDGVGTWSRGSNVTGWSALLGDRRGSENVSIYAAPARAVDLSGLPPTYIDCGSAEVFRDEDVAYATSIWSAGGQAELHVWAGGFHGFDVFAPDSEVSAQAVATRKNWITRVLSA
ncbi:alpha/beta hydrolase [uncultured Schumannella sp.]|uniref:alpha/beta hydrolase n=1 Tax=uncultured Schumannella sp. TaxID=1195956 RepID=UPI0025D989FC|nr:alpha/beta hydrolase [uncultured Schumannella sp.]